jgi:hypothetical protein
MTDEEAKGIIGLGRQLINGLPAPFLALLAVNVVVVGGLFWHMGNQLDARERVLLKLVENCSKQ